MQVGLAHGRIPGSLQPRHRLGRVSWPVVGEQDRPVCGAQAGGVKQILDGQGNARTRLLGLRQEDRHTPGGESAADAVANVRGQRGVEHLDRLQPGVLHSVK